ncbi:MAG: amidohydrolase family protein [Bacteroidetes bacterium]|nr:amidohydrolase family protein [Bacteroidota bacterium]
MSYKKYKADKIFDGKQFHANNPVLITNESGVIETIIEDKDAGDDIQIFEGIISPGFINCHCHLELSQMKNVVETGSGLVDFLIQVTEKRNNPEEAIRYAMQLADEEMYRNGIVAVGDICNTAVSIAIKRQSKIYYHNFIEALGFSQERATEIFEKFKDIYNTFCEAGFNNYTSIVPHAPYSVSPALFMLINHYSTGKIISIHNQETDAEDELFQANTGNFHILYQQFHINTDFFKPTNKSSLQSYLPLLNKASKILLIHNTFTHQSDIDFTIQQAKNYSQEIFWCLCPNANFYIEKKIPPIQMLQQNNCQLVLGTDSYSSNWQLNILDEIKTIQNNYTSVALQDLFQWATINGATALDIQNKFGSFAKGKQPGIVLIDHITDDKLTEQSTIKRLL